VLNRHFAAEFFKPVDQVLFGTIALVPRVKVFAEIFEVALLLKHRMDGQEH
jgi:hypothetical protein